MVLDQLGSFRRTGVLWLGASTIPAALQDFHQSLIEAIESSGIDRDRKQWKLHLTLYRRLRKPPPIMEIVPVTWPLDGFSLIESVSVKSGVEYHRQGHWKSGSSVVCHDDPRRKSAKATKGGLSSGPGCVIMRSSRHYQTALKSMMTRGKA